MPPRLTAPALRGLGTTAIPRFHFAVPVDGHDVPVPHFGLLLSVERFHETARRSREAGPEFVIEPYLRFAGLAFADDAQVFGV